MTTYQQLLDGVAAYYGASSDQWTQIARYGVNAETIPILEQVPGVSITRSNSGKFLSYTYNNPFSAPASPAAAIDSNVQTGAYGNGAFNASLPATATSGGGGGTTLNSGARTLSTGGTVAAIADRVTLAIAGVGLGAKLGKLIDQGIYNINPEWFDANFPTINPETWDDIATTQGGRQFVQGLFGLQGDTTTMYMDERLLAQTYMMLREQGAYSTASQATYPDAPTSWNVPSGGIGITSVESCSLIRTRVTPNTESRFELKSGGAGAVAIPIQNPTDATILVSAKELTVYTRMYGPVGGTLSPLGTYSTTQSFTYDGKTVYYGRVSNEEVVIPAANTWTSSNQYNNAQVAWIAQYGQISQAGLDGVQDDPRATTYIDPSLITGTTLDDVLRQLKQYYPELFDGSIYQDIPQADGTPSRITYIPVPYPDTTDITKPISNTDPNINPQTNPQINPQTMPDTLIQQLTDLLTTPPAAPDTGTGDSPTVTPPTGGASSLWAVYNPTQQQVNDFGAWLWSSNFVDQLLKLFNDPMQAIIGLHKVFAPPVISGASTIKVGYLDSGVSSNVVGNQYTTIDCGYVDILEYFGNVFDYDPFTQVYIYLPFVGIEKLDTGEVMRGRVGVKYHVDVITGACLAEISVIRDGSGGILYTFTGNCAVQYPISSGSYMGIVASLASIAGGVVGTISSGGALAPVAMGGVSGVLNAHTQVQHSGGFSGNAGAMGVKIPYIIITRPQTCVADNFPAFDGYPANKTTSLSACSGFVKCETCHVENVPATDAELAEIEMLLKGGIII